jgi:protein-S-isoprenylcysteine O-methyltransferase Ste14
MDYNISFFNLWLFLITGYTIIWISMGLVNKKRGKPIGSPELYNHANKKQMFLSWYIILFGSIASSLFIPVHNGIFLITGGVFFITGIFLNIIAMCTFSNLPEKVNTKGIYRFTRNPMYVGGFLFLLGLCIMGYVYSVPYGLFVLFFFMWIVMTHRTVKNEEAFLMHKYGDEYKSFKQKIPRYIGIPKS